VFSESAAFYDLIYASFKDYPAETGKVAAALQAAHPTARTILDVACGTGEHARLLTQDHGYLVDGLDLEPGFVAIAAAKNPGGAFVEADMTAFALPDTYDVVMCLFSSIAYVKTLANVTRTLRNFAHHLADGGVVLVEPWFPPERIVQGKVTVQTAEAADVKVTRMSHLERDGRLSRIRFEYLIGGPQGISHRAEVHELGLFTVAEMTECFAQAGLAVRFDPEGPSGRGLYVATRKE
jgi:SAM-dependent methyltransferase